MHEAIISKSAACFPGDVRSELVYIVHLRHLDINALYMSIPSHRFVYKVKQDGQHGILSPIWSTKYTHVIVDELWVVQHTR
jgi:hypothetical protein